MYYTIHCESRGLVVMCQVNTDRHYDYIPISGQHAVTYKIAFAKHYNLIATDVYRSIFALLLSKQTPYY